ncbi:unnamed protein product [Calypogeia fissa]
MGRVSTDRKVHMEPQEETSSSSVSSPSTIVNSKVPNVYNHANSYVSNNNIISSSSSTTSNTEGGASTLRSGLRKFSSLGGGNRKKAFTKLGSQNDYEQVWEDQRNHNQQQQPPSADTIHAAGGGGGIFSSTLPQRSNTFGGACSRGRDDVVVRIDDPSTPRAERSSTSNGANPSSNSLNVNVVCPVGPLTTRQYSSRPAEQKPSSTYEPLLKELDSFDDDDAVDDEHFNAKSSVSSPAASAPGGGPVLGAGAGSGTVPGAVSGAGSGSGPNSHPGLPPRAPKFEVTGASRVGETDRGEGHVPSSNVGVQNGGSYDFQNDLLLLEGSPSRLESVGVSGEGPANSARRKAKSFDFGIVLLEDDPPTKLIAGFLRRQTESGSNFLDLDLDMEELTPIPGPSKAAGGNVSPNPASDVKEQPTPTPSPSPTPSPTPSPERKSFEKDSSYADLVRLDDPVMRSVSTSFRAGAPTSPNEDEFWRWKIQSLKEQATNPLALPPEGKPAAVKTNVGNVGGDERYAKSREEAVRAASTTRSPSPENENGAGLESPGSAGVRWRRNGTFRPISSPQTARGSGLEDEVVKSPAHYAVRPSYSRLRSRLADLPKPPDMAKASGAIDESKMKSGQVRNSRELKSGMMGNKLKKVDEEEEDPLKVTDLPEKYRKREKGFWNLFQFAALLVILAGLVCVLAFPSLRGLTRGGLVLWKWGLLVLVVFCGRLISGWIVWVLVFIIEKNFLLRKRVVYFVYALRKGVQNCLWLGFALLAWHFMIGPKVNDNRAVVRYVTKILVCLLVAAFIVLIKTLLVKVFASSFHVNNYFERIQEALFNQYIMETLAGPPIIEYEQDDLDEEKRLNEEIAGLRDAGASGPSLSAVGNLPPVPQSDALPPRPSLNNKSTMLGAQSGMIGAQQGSGMIGKNPKADEKKKKLRGSKAELNLGISVDHLQMLDISNISAWNMKRLVHIIRNSTLTHSLEQSVSDAEGGETEIRSEWQAKSAAKRIFKNVAKEGESVIMEDDLLRFMREEETKKAFEHFDGASETKCITKQALKKWVIEVYKERRALAYSLNDTKTAVNKLHRMIDVLVGIIIIVMWLLLLGIATTKLLLFLSSQMLLLILVWGNTLKTIFEAVVFLFIMHPFDVGDRCVVDGMQLVVEEMNILTTVFLGDFNVKIWYPNSVLATKPIQNFYRSPEMGDGIDFIVQANTPVEKIAAFKERIGKYIESKPNYWHADFGLNVMQMTEGDRMKLSLGLKHTVNYQNMGEIVKRRSELLIEMRLHLQELGIEYHVPPQEVHITQRKEF